MGDNKLLAVLTVTGGLVAISAIIVAGPSKSKHEQRMELIEELDAVTSLERKLDTKDLHNQVDSLRTVIYNEINKKQGL